MPNSDPCDRFVHPYLTLMNVRFLYSFVYYHKSTVEAVLHPPSLHTASLIWNIFGPQGFEVVIFE